jgi:glucosamine-6-phosphate deaminase
MSVKEFKVDKLNVSVGTTRKEMGEAAAAQFYNSVKARLKKQQQLNVVFAAAPSQNEFLESLKNYDIEWNRINVFHMDEYVGLSIEKQQSFARFIKKMVVDKFPVGSFNAINGANLSAEEECKRYAKLLKENPIDVVCCGIGENGHLAFNDPCNADFFDIESVKTVELDQLCRKQQVNDGCFEKIQDVPTRAITVTMPALLRAKEIICVVPAKSKANAIWSTLKKSIDTSCPASILRIHNNAYLYCDKDSASKI